MFAKRICLFLLIVLTTGWPINHPSAEWAAPQKTFASSAAQSWQSTQTSLEPVIASHSPHIRQWWQLWSQRETGRGRASLFHPVYVSFHTDLLGTHTGRLFVEFKGEKKKEEGNDFQVFLVAILEGACSPLRMKIPLREEGRFLVGSMTVNGFGKYVERVYLEVKQRQHQEKPGETGAGFSYTGIFVFEESIGGETVPWTSKREGILPKNDEKVGFDVFEVPSPDEQHTRVAPKIYNVRNPWQKTTSMTPDETRHSHWEWHWGDGEVTVDMEPFNTVGTVERWFDKVGEYVVKAVSICEKGSVIREMVWHFVLDATSIHLPQSFNFETIGIVNPDITIHGPKAWVTGRPANYRVEVDFIEPPFGDTVITSIKPSEHFQMVWDKPGRQTLTVAVAAVTTYTFPKGQKVSVRNVYTRSMEVEVATLTISH